MKLPPRISSSGLSGTGGSLGEMFDRWLEAISFATSPVGKAPMRVSHGASGVVVSQSEIDIRFMMLSGNASPYEASEVIPGLNGSWVLRPYGLELGSLMEANGTSNLGGKVVRAIKNQNGWVCYYYRDESIGCVASFCVAAQDEETTDPIEGVVFQIDGPNGYSAQCTTDETGECCFNGLSPGTYTITQVSGPEGYTLAEDPVTYQLHCEISIPGCACPKTPPTIHMTRNKPDSLANIILPCTFVWQETPAALLPLGIASFTYLSTQNFFDTFTGDLYRYHLNCALSYFALTRVYETSLYGSPYRDVIRFKWPIGLGGNTCDPFSMVSGQIYSGGDPTCQVVLQG